MNRLLTLLLFLITLPGYAQTLNYTVSANDTYMGTLEATKTVENDAVQIAVISNVKVKLFISIRLNYKLNCTYKNGELLYSAVTTYVNGKIHSKNKIEKTQENYLLTKDEHTSKYLKPISYSGALIYFVPPEKNTHIFSEFDGVDKLIEKVDANQYKVTNPKNGQVSEYEYENGQLKKATIHHTLMTFTLLRSE